MKIIDAIYESSKLFDNEILSESLLLEDKMVKYDGELAPKFGWCVIYVGGPGSGKGSSTSFKSRLQGDYYNVDDLKEIERMWDIRSSERDKTAPSKPGDLPGMRYRNSDTTHRDNLETPSEHRNMGNSAFVSELHYEMKPLSQKWKNQILDNPENADDARAERLPNIIFDITGDEVAKVTEIIDALKPRGYKIAVIWVLSTVERAFRNNLSRPRAVDIDSVFLPKHKDVIEAQEAIFSTGVINNIDEFWVIDSAVEINPKEDPVGYQRAQNVYHIPCNPDGLKEFAHIANRIDYNKKELNRLVQKRVSGQMKNY